MFSQPGWGVHGLFLFTAVAVWLLIAALVFFALYWTVRLAVAHALRARDRGPEQTPPAPENRPPA